MLNERETLRHTTIQSDFWFFYIQRGIICCLYYVHTCYIPPMDKHSGAGLFLYFPKRPMRIVTLYNVWFCLLFCCHSNLYVYGKTQQSGPKRQPVSLPSFGNRINHRQVQLLRPAPAREATRTRRATGKNVLCVGSTNV